MEGTALRSLIHSLPPLGAWTQLDTGKQAISSLTGHGGTFNWMLGQTDAKVKSNDEI